jgi:hypothetical protein
MIDDSLARKLTHRKSREGKIELGYPSNAVGKDGDEQTRFISSLGLYFFKKYHNEWYGVAMTKLTDIKKL